MNNKNILGKHKSKQRLILGSESVLHVPVGSLGINSSSPLAANETSVNLKVFDHVFTSVIGLRTDLNADRTLHVLACVQPPPPLRKNRGERRLCVTVDNRVQRSRDFFTDLWKMI